jgi:NADH:ubiquinone reductase (H+-translocating)
MTAALQETRPREMLSRAEAAPTNRKRVLIIGGGFAGVAAARVLRRCNAEVVLIDRRNHHIFQPLLYQVATANLSPADT